MSTMRLTILMTAKEVLENLISTIEKNSTDNKAIITNVDLWAKSWREELNQVNDSVLDEVAKKLGYIDAEHLESNICNYGEPLPQWWEVIKELVNKLPLNYVSGCTQCEIVDARNEIIESGYMCIKCHKLFKAYDH